MRKSYKKRDRYLQMETERDGVYVRFCDLHTHTNASDGSMTPSELVDYAKEKGLAAIAVTDHDTVDGLDEAMTRGRAVDQWVIPGIEISTVVDGCDVHIVGLFVDYHNSSFMAAVSKMTETREERNLQMIERLAAAGYKIKQSDMDQYNGSVITRAHIGAALIEQGYAKDLREALIKYMSKGTPGYVARVTPSAKECLAIIHNAGGLAFVAHINRIDQNNPDHGMAICRRILGEGADGLETRYSEYDDKWRLRTEELAAQFGVLRSGGSDFHGVYKKGLDLATGYGDLEVPYSFLEEMVAHIRNR